MQKTTAQDQSSLSYLPPGLKAIIFEYLPLSSFSSLALVCHDFNLILSKRSDLWARHIFQSFLIITQKDMLFMEDDLLKFSLKSQDLKSNFYEMTDSKKLLTDNLHLRQKFNVFLSAFLPSEDCQQFVKDIFKEVRSPNYPVPCLKKDVHHFSTKTLFQNFLTEVYFDIAGKPLFPMKKQKLVEGVIRQIRAKISNSRFDQDDLVHSRWYMLSAIEDPNTKNQLLDDHAKAIEEVKPHQKNPLLLKRDVQETKPKALGLSQLLCMSRREESEIVLSDEEDEFTIDNGEESSNTQVKMERSSAEDFYWMLRIVTENHCKMTFSFLKSIQKPHSLLYEYTRLWNKFVLIVISFNQTFAPFASLFNKIYDEECSELPTFPEFSTWRLMIKIWIDQVFSSLTCRLNESFRYILMTLRNVEEACSDQSLVAQRCSSCIDTTQAFAGSDHLYKDFLYNPRKLSYNQILDRDVLTKLLRGFSDALGDISYNEFTIFYWDCSSINKETPKGALESLIMQDSKLLYNQRKECMKQNSSCSRQFFKDDFNLIESLMGKPFGLELKNYQVFLLKQLISGTLREKSDNSDLTFNVQRADTKPNLEKVFRGLCMSSKIQKRKASSEENIILRGSRTNDPGSPSKKCLAYLLEKQKDIDLQDGELEEMKYHRHLRGFLIPDEKYTSFLELSQNPRRDEIEALGVEGRNVREELEALEDQLIFL